MDLAVDATLVRRTSIRLQRSASTTRCSYPPVDAGIYRWIRAGIYGWMLRPPGHGIYHQMLGPALDRACGTIRASSPNATARSYRNSHTSVGIPRLAGLLGLLAQGGRGEHTD